MDNSSKVVEYIFVEHDGITISVGEIVEGTGISLREVEIIVDKLTEQGLLSDMKVCEIDDPEAKVGEVKWE